MKLFLMVGCLICPTIAWAVNWLPIGENKLDNVSIDMEFDSINIATNPPTVWLRKVFKTAQYDRALNKHFYIDQSRFAFDCDSGNAREIARSKISVTGNVVWSTSIPARIPMSVPPGSNLEAAGNFLCYLQRTGFERPSLSWGQSEWVEVKDKRPGARSYISESSATYRNGLVLFRSLVIFDSAASKGTIPPGADATTHTAPPSKVIHYVVLDCNTIETAPLMAFLYGKDDYVFRVLLPAAKNFRPVGPLNRDRFKKMCSASGGGAGSNQRVDGGGSQSEATSGSGFLINREGYIATNHHVIDGCKKLQVRLPDKQVTMAFLVASDAPNDTAIIRTAVSNTDFARLRDTPVRSGESVVVVGFPLAGLLAAEANVSTGIISATAGLNNDYRNLQISAAVQPGNSGGPLLDSAGFVIGIVVAKLDALVILKLTGSIPENINFAVKSDLLKVLLDANGVKYSSGNRGRMLDVSDNTDQAKQFTVLIVCSR